jgi:replicative DNA helicase
VEPVSFAKYEQESLLAIMALGKDGAPNVARTLVPKENFDAYYSTLFGKIDDFIGTHNEAPGENHFFDLVEQLCHERPDEAETYRELHASIGDTFGRGLNYAYVFKRAELFGRHARLRRGVGLALQELTVFDEDRLNEAEKHLRQSMETNAGVMDLGIDSHDPESMLRGLDTEGAERFLTGIDGLDLYSMNPARKELLIIVGAYGTGKSFGMNDMALAGLHLSRANTLVFPCEMSEEEWAERVVQSEMGMGRRAQIVKVPRIHSDEGGLFVDLEHRDIKIPSMYDVENRAKIERHFEWMKRRPRLCIKAVPPNEFTTARAEAYQDALFAQKGVMFDSVYVDYLGVMQIKKPEFERNELSLHAVQLRGMASRRNQAVVTGAQTNRTGIKSQGRSTGGDVSRDITSMQTANKVLIYNQTPTEAALGIARLSFDKNRNDKKIEVIIAQNYAAGQYALSSAIMSREYMDFRDQKDDELNL